MNIHDIEKQLIAEGLAGYNMESRATQESESTRMGEDGEYDLASYMEAGDSPEAQLIIEQLLESTPEHELAAMEAEDEPEPEPEPEAEPQAWDFLFA